MIQNKLRNEVCNEVTTRSATRWKTKSLQDRSVQERKHAGKPEVSSPRVSPRVHRGFHRGSRSKLASRPAQQNTSHKQP